MIARRVLACLDHLWLGSPRPLELGERKKIVIDRDRDGEGNFCLRIDISILFEPLDLCLRTRMKTSDR